MVDLASAYEVIQSSWTAQDWDVWKATCAPDYSFDPGFGGLRDLDKTMQWNRGFFVAFPDYTEQVRQVHVSRTSVVAELLGRATLTGPLDLGDGSVLPANGRAVEIPYAKVLEFDGDGLAVRDRQYHDMFGFLQQLGVPPG